jgi:hypothetical protein
MVPVLILFSLSNAMSSSFMLNTKPKVTLPKTINDVVTMIGLTFSSCIK